MKTKILLVDDHQLFLDGLVEILSTDHEIEVTGIAHNGKEALQFLEHHEVDIMISDISMPEIGGAELLLTTKMQYPMIKTIILSMEDNGTEIAKLLRDGADSYMVKNVSKQELLDGIDKVRKGEQYVSPQIQKALLDSILTTKAEFKAEEIRENLTDREKQILVMIAQEFTQTEIAEKLFISPNTVVYHKRKLMMMLEVKSAAGLVRKAAEMNLI